MAGGRAGSPEPAAGVPEGPRRPRTAGGPFRKTGRWRMGGSGCGAPGENRGFLPLQMKRRPRRAAWMHIYEIRPERYCFKSRFLRAAKTNPPDARAIPTTPAARVSTVSPVFADLEAKPTVPLAESPPGLPLLADPLFPDPSFEGSSDEGESGSTGLSGAGSSAAIVKVPGTSSAIS